MVTSEHGGHATVINLRIDNEYHEVEIDNRWVVSDSPILSKMFQAHIMSNVEHMSNSATLSSKSNILYILYPTIVRLRVQFENGQHVYFTSDDAYETPTQSTVTTLTS
ncbi:hypothetical protein AVEN_140666-1 [Araneus ventricosus]|uniref:Uncharacterized protein n=1 Tax=Araneus ventricosus TaxID=182803 RepID=A0A4Y2C4C1_ARAVE|nr:hypothetical protein AVEN_140666-1 [Araneus ventricosus]